MSFGILVFTMFFVVLVSGRVVLDVKAAKIWIVDGSGAGDFIRIQEAIDAADNGDTIEVMPGIFYERLLVNKSVTLTGYNGSIVDGNGSSIVVTVEAHFVHISDLTIQHSGSSEPGILLNGTRGCVVQRNNITENGCGVQLTSSDGNDIMDNLVLNNVFGLRLETSEKNTYKNNSIIGCTRTAFYFDSSKENSVVGNYLSDNAEGIWFESSGYNFLRNNTMIQGSFSFAVYGVDLTHFFQDVDTSNRIDDKPIYYWVNEHNKQIPSDAGYVAIVNSTNIVLKGLNLSAQEEGVILAYTNDSRIENMYVSNARYGLRLFSCSNITVEGNVFDRNYKNLRLDSSKNNLIRENLIYLGHEGIFLDNSSMNVFSENTFVKNINTVFIYYSSGNLFYHNNFIRSEGSHVFIAPAKVLLLNSWDDGIEGNYWSDIVLEDSDSDGVSNIPYVLGSTNLDRHPLMGNCSVFRVQLDKIQDVVETVCNSSISDFAFSPNLISFNVSGDDGTVGFCRLVFPRDLMNGSYDVLIDDSPPLSLKELNSEIPDKLVLYFTYSHSTHRVLVIPEYSLLLVFFFVAAAFATVFSIRKKAMWRRVRQLNHLRALHRS